MFEKYPYKSFKPFFLPIIIVLSCLVSNAQSKLNEEYSSSDIENLINSNPVQSLDIAQLLLSKPNIKNKDKARLIFLIFKAQKAKSNYSSALSFLYEEKKYEKYLSEKDKIDIEIEKVKMLRAISLDKQVKLLIEELEKRVENVSDSKLKSYLQTAILIEKTKNLGTEGKLDEAIGIMESLEKKSKSVFSRYPDLKYSCILPLGVFYIQKGELGKAEKNFELIIKSLNNQKNINLYVKTLALCGLAEVYSARGKFNESISILNEALLNSKNLSNVMLQETVYQQLHNNYLALNDSKNYKLTSINFIRVQTQNDSLVQESLDATYKLISDENTELYSGKEREYFKILYFLIALYILVIGYYVILWRKQKGKYKNLEEIIKYVEVTRKNIYNVLPVKNQEAKKHVISKELEDEILKKLKRFEKSGKFVNKDVSLALLAVQFDTNVKYLSDVINSNYSLNFNAYINTLRINYIIEKLKTEPDFKNYKISYLADYCGFAAHSSFATVFKSITGISPVKFIELLKNENEKKLLNDIS